MDVLFVCVVWSLEHLISCYANAVSILVFEVLCDGVLRILYCRESLEQFMIECPWSNWLPVC